MPDINPEIKGAIESLIFISDKSLGIKEIQTVIEGVDTESIQAIVKELQHEYEDRKSGIKIVEVAGGYQMVTSPNYVTFIKKFYKLKHAERLSMPSLETLAIVAYKQPATKVEIEAIRGVNVDGVVKNLLEKGLIRIVGRKEVIGRPFVYGTTRNFLEYFGLNSVNELPPIEDFVSVLQEKEKKEALISPLTAEEIAEAGIQAQVSPDSSSVEETDEAANSQNAEPDLHKQEEKNNAA